MAARAGTSLPVSRNSIRRCCHCKRVAADPSLACIDVSNPECNLMVAWWIVSCLSDGRPVSWKSQQLVWEVGCWPSSALPAPMELPRGGDAPAAVKPALIPSDDANRVAPGHAARKRQGWDSLAAVASKCGEGSESGHSRLGTPRMIAHGANAAGQRRRDRPTPHTIAGTVRDAGPRTAVGDCLGLLAAGASRGR